MTQDLLERKSDTALRANQEWYADESGDILYSAPPKKVMPVFVLSELDAMSEDLDNLRSGEFTPFARLTDEQMRQIEAERPGLYGYEHRGEV